MITRLKEIRKYFHLTQADFGKKIGLKGAAIGLYESGDRNITEQTIKLVCSVFNVNEEWLRTGEGEMFNQTSTLSFEKYAKQKGMTDIEKEIVMNYLDLDTETRGKMIEMLRKSFSKYAEIHNISEKDKSKVDEKINIISNNNVKKIQVPARGGKYEIELTDRAKKAFEADSKLNYEPTDDDF